MKDYLFVLIKTIDNISYDYQHQVALELLKPYMAKDFKPNNRYFWRGKYYSISHNQNKVMVTICNSPIGCDVQKIEKRKTKVEKRFYHLNERNNIKNAKDFYRIWTMKEAFGKYQKTGIQFNLNQYDFSKILEQEIITNKKHSLFSWIDDGYAYAIYCDNAKMFYLLNY